MSGWRHRWQERAGRLVWARDGTVAIIWSLSGVSIMAFAGVGVDYARALGAKAQLQSAVDSAALAAEKLAVRPMAERVASATAMFRASMFNAPENDQARLTIEALPDGGHRASAEMPIETTFAKLFFGGELKVTASAEADQESGPVEVALVLDNTGSMASDMTALRSSAEELVNTLYAAAEKVGDVNVAVVPFVAQVNIGDTPTTRAWVDTVGAAPFNGELLEDRLVARRTWTSADGATCQNVSTLPFAGYTGPYRLRWERGTGASSGFCFGYTPASINHMALFGLIPNAPWKGCVEARPEPFDITDDAPNPANPATMFVPYFWVDNADGLSNSYLTDSGGDVAGATMTNSQTSTSSSNAQRARAFNVFKYRGANGAIDAAAPDTQGPNRSCPTPVVPLTTDKPSIVNAVRSMLHWNSSGTNQVEGLAWGWRVLSPTPPFTQGVPYGEKKKVIVLMTDGQNTNVGTGSSNAVFGSDYSAFGHLAQWTQSSASPTGLRATLPASFRRDAITSSSAFVNYINNREIALCNAIKATGIEIFTIIYRESDTTARDILRACATPEANGVKYHYVADSQSELRDAFNVIGSSIGQLRLTR